MFKPASGFHGKSVIVWRLRFENPAGKEKLNYIHHNPVTGKWKLAKDFVSYEHSSASFYEDGIARHFIPKHYKDL